MKDRPAPTRFKIYFSFLGAKYKVDRNGFTLLELLVALTILMVVMAFILNVTSQVSKLWQGTSNAIGEWQSARVGFEAMNRKISQATLNTTWAYFDGPNGSGNLTASNPVSYGRYSELQFVSGNAGTVLAGVTNCVTQSVFFQAPLGVTRNSNLQGLPNLINACGFYIQYNSDAEFKPSLSIFQKSKNKSRFRLMELLEPSESLSVYASIDPTDFQWFLKGIQNKIARPLAENVIGLFLVPRYSRFDTATGSALAPAYYYNSRVRFQFTDGGVSGNTLHQLPPLIQVVMVAIDEVSALRLASQYGDNMPPLFNGAPFVDATRFDSDLAQLEANLNSKGLRYRIFSSFVGIRGAKWNGDTL